MCKLGPFNIHVLFWNISLSPWFSIWDFSQLQLYKHYTFLYIYQISPVVNAQRYIKEHFYRVANDSLLSSFIGFNKRFGFPVKCNFKENTILHSRQSQYDKWLLSSLIKSCLQPSHRAWYMERWHSWSQSWSLLIYIH